MGYKNYHHQSAPAFNFFSISVFTHPSSLMLPCRCSFFVPEGSVSFHILYFSDFLHPFVINSVTVCNFASYLSAIDVEHFIKLTHFALAHNRDCLRHKFECRVC
jgi:hypothetical protein